MINMQSKEDKNIVFIKLLPDENLNIELKNACKKHNVKTAVILSGIGQLKETEIGYFKAKGDYLAEKINKPYEILMLTGNICKNAGEHILHLHITLGDENKNTIGGHFIDGKVAWPRLLGLL